MTRALIASLLAAGALAAAPGAALAQDAGGHQYDDPLANTPTTPSSPSTPSTPSTGTSGASTGTAPSAGTASTSGASATTSTAAATAAGKGEIPRTGFPVGWLTLAGFFALGGGFALRRAAGFESA